MSPVPAGQRVVAVGRIWASLRATFQIRTSSITPAKKPPLLAMAPVEVSEVPRAACWMLAICGWKALPRASVRSRSPSRYSRQVPVVAS